MMKRKTEFFKRADDHCGDGYDELLFDARDAALQKKKSQKEEKPNRLRCLLYYYLFFQK